MTPRDRRLIVPETGRRDTIIAVVCGLFVLGFIALAFVTLARQHGAPSTNQLHGIITAKHNAEEKESEVSFGTKGVKSKVVDSGYSFDIQVPAENRTYEVPVSKKLYESRKVGDSQDFIRPRSEQK